MMTQEQGISEILSIYAEKLGNMETITAKQAKELLNLSVQEWNKKQLEKTKK
jgi:hypothetical protein